MALILGIGYFILQFAIGEIFDFEFSFHDIPILSPLTLATFFTAFGGTGFTMEKATTAAGHVIFATSISLGLLAAMLMVFLIAIPLKRIQQNAVGKAKEMIGKEATVITPIPINGLGEITYNQNGYRYSSPAMASKKIPQNETVIIKEVNDNIFVVEKLEIEK
jgi:membrane protein implicated in regulation of membrane protease activity